MLDTTSSYPRFIWDSTGMSGCSDKLLKGHIDCADIYTIDEGKHIGISYTIRHQSFLICDAQHAYRGIS